MICLSAIIGQRVIRLLLYFGLYLAGEQLGKLSTIILLRKNVLETLCVLGHMVKYKMMILSLANRERRARVNYTMSVCDNWHCISQTRCSLGLLFVSLH